MRLFGADPLLYIALFLGLAFSMAAGFVTQQQTLLPLFGGLLVWPFLIWALRHARVDVAVRFAVFWAASVFLLSVVAGRLLGAGAQAAVPGSTDYIADQLLWLTGQANAVQPPAAWLPGLARRIGLLLAGGALTAGLLPLIVAACDLAILGLWTANLFGAAHPIGAALLSLSPWTLAEIIAWVALGVYVAEPIVTGDVRALLTRDRRRLFFTGLVALALALILHLLLPGLLASPLRALIL